MGFADDAVKVLIPENAIQTRIGELGSEIARDYAGREPVLIGVLKGAAVFLVDLAREINLPISIDFMAVSSYGTSTRSTGVVRILKDLDESIDGRDVLIVEDIVDTGLTLHYLLDNLRERRPRSMRVCALLRKPHAATHGPAVDYLGFEIPDAFVVGYGLDYAERYRNLRYVGVLNPALDQKG